VKVPRLLPSLGSMDTLASRAEQLARVLLQESLPRRWAHVQGVAARARSLAPVLGTDAELLEAAAWLHDIGYAPSLVATGLHSLDGAAWSRTTRAPSSRPGNADSPTCWPSSSSPRRTRLAVC
jgi:HD domain